MLMLMPEWSARRHQCGCGIWLALPESLPNPGQQEHAASSIQYHLQEPDAIAVGLFDFNPRTARARNASGTWGGNGKLPARVPRGL
jgi:hypothetical protein